MKESELDPDLVTVAVNLNVKHLTVVTVRQHEQIIETVFISDDGLDRQRYRHLRRIAKRRWLSGKPVTGEHSNQRLWRHVRRMNEDAARRCPAALRMCARGIPAAYCSLSACARSGAEGRANPAHEPQAGKSVAWRDQPVYS